MICIVGILLCLFFAQKINLACADLGRHIKNGEVFLRQNLVIDSNFYSYTEPQYHTITHHWGTGVIFYLAHRYFGFNGLSVFYILINLLAFLFFFKAAERASNFTYAFLFALLSIPLAASRTEIRPEGFSCLMLGIYFYLLSRFKGEKINLKFILTLALLQVCWVNLHIFFFMGPLLVAIFLCDSWVNNKGKETIRRYFLLFLVTTAVCAINPFGVKGALAPLTIFKEYGYMIAENQSVIFMQKRFGSFVYLYFEVMFALMVISYIGVILKKKAKNFIAPFLVGLFFSALSWRAIRGIPMFGLFFIPIASGNFYPIIQGAGMRVKEIFKYILRVISIVLVLILVFLRFNQPVFKMAAGIGLMPGAQMSAYFFRQNKIEGPVFNNYDVGGYLIYNLFPQQRVFVDNRPEAYSVSFLKEVYVPMQEDEGVWKKIDSHYDFNAIYFYRHDYTPWAQPFLIRRIQDPQWAPVFVDGYVLILLKRNEKNRQLIQLYELPQGMFSIGK
ncbi:MAG: hypothetical protein PHY56_02870 [Candidatus Omnitrophica bacterium]|nr:hypothetical protein [Candidatus Omnitrophota bacterium]